MRDSFLVKFALGYSSPLTLSSYDCSYHVIQQTSMKMYWPFASDLWAIATNNTLIGGKSLISTSSNFAFNNVSTQNLLIQILTLISPLNAGLTVLESTISPFGVIDMKYSTERSTQPLCYCHKEYKPAHCGGQYLKKNFLQFLPSLVFAKSLHFY
ncbi:hypothetical protein THRCLA_02393 [Thraustotheca clavata]|uniref:Uncharacterized protein n=1 Tax=Thraustotheca clavata TaxID=74557 RepID=A0A1W0A5B7_9STRA|nr:hypothetical protein THRCLA_02393 [Thraustotheca clavata]